MCRHIIYIIFLTLISVCSCSRSGMNSSTEFADSLLLPATPARCMSDGEMMWLHVMIETVEADRLGMGDSIALSPLWTVRNLLDERSWQCYAAGADVTTDGTLADAWYAFCRYGSATYTSYCTRPFDQPTPDAAYTTAARAAQHAATTARKQHATPRKAGERISTALDQTLGPPPVNAYLYGMEYTPRQLAESMALPDEWKAYTSFADKPYYIDIQPDMYGQDKRYAAHNLPIDSLLSLVCRSLREGHPVAWEGDLHAGESDNDITDMADVTAQAERYAADRLRLSRSNSLKPVQQRSIIGLARSKDTDVLHFIVKDAPDADSSASPLRGYSKAYMPLTAFLTGTTMVMVKQPQHRSAARH